MNVEDMSLTDDLVVRKLTAEEKAASVSVIATRDLSDLPMCLRTVEPYFRLWYEIQRFGR